MIGTMLTKWSIRVGIRLGRRNTVAGIIRIRKVTDLEVVGITRIRKVTDPEVGIGLINVSLIRDIGLRIAYLIIGGNRVDIDLIDGNLVKGMNRVDIDLIADWIYAQ